MDRLDALEAETRTEAGSTRASLEQYGELATTVSAAVGELTGIPAQSLTPSEVEDELLRMNAPAALAQSVRHLLNECEHVRYRRADADEKRADFASLVESSRTAVTEVARL